MLPRKLLDKLARVGYLFRRTYDDTPPDKSDEPDPEKEEEKREQLARIRHETVARERVLKRIEAQADFWHARRQSQGDGNPHIW